MAGRGGGRPTEAQLAALEQGRGKRPKQERDHVGMRLDPAVREAIERLAERHGCLYAGKPQISKLLERIATGELLLVPATVATPLLELPGVARGTATPLEQSDTE